MPLACQPVLCDCHSQRHLVTTLGDLEAQNRIVAEAVRRDRVVTGPQLSLSVEGVATRDPHTPLVPHLLRPTQVDAADP